MTGNAHSQNAAKTNVNIINTLVTYAWWLSLVAFARGTVTEVKLT